MQRPPAPQPAERSDTLPEPAPAGEPRPATPTSRRSAFMTWGWTLSRRASLVFAAVSLLAVGSAVLVAIRNLPRPVASTTTIKQRPYVPPITTVGNNLSGLQVDAAVNARPVTGVMIENSIDARPQSGLDSANIVFEAIAEGGITRFLALFQDTQPDYIGPVRSARPYYVQWCMTFDCALAHAGGSPEALQNIRDWGTKDLNDSRAHFWRTSNRYAPHNLYTSSAKLAEYEAGKGFGAASFTPLARKAAAPSKTPSARSINVNISSATFNSHYDYDAKNNRYLRSQNGAPHMTVNSSGQEGQIAPKVVVVMVMQYGIAPDKHSSYNVIGSGEALIFQDGIITPATWSKGDLRGPLTLTGADGKPVGLNPGQTWFTAVSARNLVTYQ